MTFTETLAAGDPVALAVVWIGAVGTLLALTVGLVEVICRLRHPQ